MKGTKYLSEIIDISTLKTTALNIIKAPTGCGKTYFALNTISSLCYDTKHEAVYLIDTINGKEQILKSYNTSVPSKKWIEEIVEDGLWFYGSDNVVVMTYAKFGMILIEHPDFYQYFRYIICDEMHNLIKFQYFDKNKENNHRIANAGLKRATEYSETTVIALTATPSKVIKEYFVSGIAIYEVPIDQDELIHYAPKNVRYFSDVHRLLSELPTQQTGILFTGRVVTMIELEAEAKEKGFHPISIWSINNTDHPMNEAQLLARKSILEDYEIPSEYNLLLINSASETSIKIKSPVDFMVVNSTNLDTKIQVHGRVNKDLETLYLLITDKTIVVPQEFLNKKLFTEEKQALCDYLKLRNPSNGRQLSWKGVRPKLEQSKYQISDGRDNNRRYVIIQTTNEKT